MCFAYKKTKTKVYLRKDFRKTYYHKYGNKFVKPYSMKLCSAEVTFCLKHKNSCSLSFTYKKKKLWIQGIYCIIS